MTDIYRVDFRLTPDKKQPEYSLDVNETYEASDPAGAFLAALADAAPAVHSVSRDDQAVYFGFYGWKMNVKLADVPGMVSKLPYARRVG
jgi:hypothetical protein